MEQITQYFPQLTEHQRVQFEQLGALYNDWNAKINVISRKDIANLYHNHVLHSLTIAKYVQFKASDTVLDVGTGGGFPGLPLALLFPDTQFMLVDSIQKKLNVVESISAALGMHNVTTQHARVEQLQGKYDYVVSRAVTRLDTMWGWVQQRITFDASRTVPNGLLYLKGGDISGEISNNCVIQKIPLQTLINEPSFADKALVHIYKK